MTKLPWLKLSHEYLGKLNKTFLDFKKAFLQIKIFKLNEKSNCFKTSNSLLSKCLIWTKQKKEEFVIILFKLSIVDTDFSVLYFLINMK